MAMTIARAARNAGARLIPSEILEGAIKSFPAADEPLDALPTERRAALVSQFARSLHGVGVAKTTDLVRLMLSAVDAMPRGAKVVALNDAISLIAARNLVTHLASHVGLAWAESMRLQAAVSDLARIVSTHGGGILEATADERRAAVVVRTRTTLVNDAEPAWLVALRELVGQVFVGGDRGASTVEFALVCAASAAA
jgi:hypothetical protein